MRDHVNDNHTDVNDNDHDNDRVPATVVISKHYHVAATAVAILSLERGRACNIVIFLVQEVFASNANGGHVTTEAHSTRHCESRLIGKQDTHSQTLSPTVLSYSSPPSHHPPSQFALHEPQGRVREQP